MGAGGFGIWNACASEPDHVIDGEDACGNDPETEPITVVPLFSATSEQFGQRCGGQVRTAVWYNTGWGGGRDGTLIAQNRACYSHRPAVFALD